MHFSDLDRSVKRLFCGLSFLLKMKSAPQAMSILLLLLVSAVIGSSCASRKIYDATQTGRFDGALNLKWVAPDKFVFVPDPDQPFTFTRANGEIIQPKAMYTDGGSLPRLLQADPRFSPMRYAPAYIIHDWLHLTHNRNALANGDAGDIKLSATILAEGIKTLMEDDNSIVRKPFVFNIIYQSMKTPFAEYAAHITPWHSDLPPAETVAAMGARFYTAQTPGEATMSTRITKEKTNPEALAKLFFPSFPPHKPAAKADAKAQ